MIITRPVGITSFGVALPPGKILIEEIERAQGKARQGLGLALGVISKTVPGRDQDTITLATQAASQALAGLSQEARLAIGALFIGSESHPYAVKPSGTVVKSVLGLSENLAMADLEFACKAATQGLQIGVSYVLSGLAQSALIIGADTAQSRPGDALEFTAGAGAAAFLLGRDQILAHVLATLSIATDTPDFWRRAGENFPQHSGRFSGEPAYFYHVSAAANKIMTESGLNPKDFAYCVFHTPNGKFPQAVARQLGFSAEQLTPSLVVEKIGNTYTAAVPLALVSILEVAKPQDKILVVSYGSGSGSDAFILETTDLLPSFNQQHPANLSKLIEQLTTVDYETYSQVMESLAH